MASKPANPQVDQSALGQLKPNPLNPRKPWEKWQREAFRDSVKTFGDLSGIGRNLTTGQLVGGHKRVEEFKRVESASTFVNLIEQPDSSGTVRQGFIKVGDQLWSYREVQWTPSKEVAANIAANKWTAEFDDDLLGQMLTSIHGEYANVMLGISDHKFDELTKTDRDRGTGKLLGVLDVTVGNPKHKVEDGQTFKVGRHVLVCSSVLERHDVWSPHLTVGSLFCPYPGPLIFATEKAGEKKVVAVQPDPFICGHILDRSVEAGLEVERG